MPTGVYPRKFQQRMASCGHLAEWCPGRPRLACECGICDEPVDRVLAWPDPMSSSLDHIIPVSLGGEHTRANAQLAHLICNTRKGAKLEKASA